MLIKFNRYSVNSAITREYSVIYETHSLFFKLWNSVRQIGYYVEYDKVYNVIEYTVLGATEYILAPFRKQTYC